MLILWTNVDKKSLETKFLIAICRPTVDKWQSENLFLAIFYPCLSIVKSVFDSPYPVCSWNIFLVYNLTYSIKTFC